MTARAEGLLYDVLLLVGMLVTLVFVGAPMLMRSKHPHRRGTFVLGVRVR